MSTSADPVQEGIAALKAGDRNRARSYFRAAILRDPRNEQAWLGLSTIVADEKERHYCLNRVLALNPNNQAAQQALITLTSDASAQTIVVMSERHLLAASAQTIVQIAKPRLMARSSEIKERNISAATQIGTHLPASVPAEPEAQPDLSELQVFTLPISMHSSPRIDLSGLALEAQQTIARQSRRQRTLQLALICIGLLSMLLAAAVVFVI